MTRTALATICWLALGASCFSEDAPAPVAVGKPAPDITVTGIDGKPLKLSQKTADGKNVVLIFSRAHW